MSQNSIKVTGMVIGSQLTKSERSYAVDMFSVEGRRVTVFVPISKASKEVIDNEEQEDGTIIEKSRNISTIKEGSCLDISCIQSKQGEAIIHHETGEPILDDAGEPRFAKSDAIRGLSVTSISKAHFDNLVDLYAKFSK